MLPFSDEVRFAFANGSVVKEMLEHSVSKDRPSAGFLSVHGLQFWWDPKAKPGERVQRAVVRSNPGTECTGGVCLAAGVSVPLRHKNQSIRCR